MAGRIPELLGTALAFYRAPARYSRLRDRRVPLPPGVSELLAAHADALSAARIADTAARLGSSPEECREAVTFFIRQALLEVGGDYYRILGVPRDADTALIRQHYHYLIRLFHPDRDTRNEGWENLYAPLINEAWNQLRQPQKRASYDATLDAPDAFDAVFTRSGEGPASAVRAAAGTGASAGAGTGSRRGAGAGAGRGAAAGAGVGSGVGGAQGRGGWRRLAGWLGSACLAWSPRGIAILLGCVSLGLLIWIWQVQPRQSVLRVQSPPGTGTGDSRPVAQQPVTEALTGAEATTEVAGLLGDSAGTASPGAERSSPPSAGQSSSSVAGVSSTGSASRSMAQREADIEARIRERLAAASRAVLGGRSSSTTSRRDGAAASQGARVVPSPSRSAASSRETSSPPLESNAGADVAPETLGESGQAVAATENTGAGEAAIDGTAMEMAGRDEAVREGAAIGPAGRDEAVREGAVIEQAGRGEVATDGELPPLNAAQLSGLLQIFQETYEAGDAEGFAVLFDDRARTTDAHGREAIFGLYRQFFKRPETRQITFDRMLWEYLGPYRTRGLGKAQVVTVPYDGSSPVSGELSMTFEVEQTAAGPVITGLYYR